MTNTINCIYIRLHSVKCCHIGQVYSVGLLVRDNSFGLVDEIWAAFFQIWPDFDAVTNKLSYFGQKQIQFNKPSCDSKMILVFFVCFFFYQRINRLTGVLSNPDKE